MIIAVDYGGTLNINGKPNMPLIARLRQEQRRGNVVILWTRREGKDLIDAVNFLRQYGFVPNYVNCNAPAGIHKIGYDCRKVYADVYIDDQSVR